MVANNRVKQAMAEVAQSLSRPSELPVTLSALTQSARDTIPGIDHASINILHLDGRLETLAPTDPVVVQLDELQAELKEGPCYDAAKAGTVYESADLQNDSRWPTYGPRAAALGIGSQMGLDIPTGGSGKAALNVYSRAAGPFGEAADLAEMFATSAGMTLGFAQTLDTLTKALKTRSEIGKAMGIVMERYHVDGDRAFRFLINVSQRSNTPLTEVATDIVGSLDRRSRPEA